MTEPDDEGFAFRAYGHAVAIYQLGDPWWDEPAPAQASPPVPRAPGALRRGLHIRHSPN